MTHFESHPEHLQGSERLTAWKTEKDKLDRMTVEGFQRFVDELPNIEQAFHLRDRCLRCIDEGIVGGVHIAGSGILMDEPQAVEAMRAARVEGIYSHAGCGAAALYAKQKGLDLSRPDEYGKQWAQEVADKLGVPYMGHIEKSQMQRSPEFHHARVAYYDGTGSFDPSRAPGLPAGFVISRRFLESGYAQTEAEVAVSIATGDHGYGDLISSDEPFYLIPVGDPEDSAFSVESLSRELQQIVEKSNGRVRIMGFNRPEVSLAMAA